MKHTAQIEWVSGSVPQTDATKLIAVKEADLLYTTTGAFYADDQDSAPCWHFDDGKEVPIQLAEVIAWADMPDPFGRHTAEEMNTQRVPVCEAQIDRIIIELQHVAVELSEIIGRDLIKAAPHQLEGINDRITKLVLVEDRIRNGTE